MSVPALEQLYLDLASERQSQLRAAKDLEAGTTSIEATEEGRHYLSVKRAFELAQNRASALEAQIARAQLQTVDGRRDAGGEIHRAFTQVVRHICQLCFEAVMKNDTGGMASALYMSGRDVETWAKVWAHFGPDLAQFMDGSVRSDVKFWRALVECPEPTKAFEWAALNEASPLAIRREFCEASERKAARRLRARVDSWANGVIRLFCDLSEGPPVRWPDSVTVVIEEGR